MATPQSLAASDAEIERGNQSITRGLEAYERADDTRPPFYLTWPEVRLLSIAGVGFFVDAYDLFIINVRTCDS